MKKYLKASIRQGLITFLATLLLALLMFPKVVGTYVVIGYIFIATLFGLTRAISVYSYKKKTVVDERLESKIVKAQSIWFNICIFFIALPPIIGFIYSNFFGNVLISMRDSVVALRDLSYFMMHISAAICFIIIVGLYITVKILMKPE